MPPIPGSAKNESWRAILKHQTCVSSNKLDLAFHALKLAAELVPSRGSVWKDLIRAAKLMQLEEVIPDLEKRFVASASLAGDRRQEK